MLSSSPRQKAAAAGAALLLLLVSIWGVHALFWPGFSTLVAARHTAPAAPLPARPGPVYQVHGRWVMHNKLRITRQPVGRASSHS